MKTRLLLASIIVLSLLPTFSFADVLTFGPLVSTSQISLPTDYAGFDWPTNGWLVIPNGLWDGNYGNTYGAPSGGAASSASGENAVVSNILPFTFLGADFTSWGINDSLANFSATTITVFGYDAGGGLVGEASTNLSNFDYIFLSANFQNVTKLVFQGSGGSFDSDWLMDDLTYILSGPTVNLSVFTLGSGNLQIIGSGSNFQVGTQYNWVLQSTTDFRNWTAISTNTFAASNIMVTNIVQTTNAMTFYRVNVR